MNCDNPLCPNSVYEISNPDDPIKFCEDCKETGLNYNSRYQHLETPVDPSDGLCTTEILSDSMINQWWYHCNDCPAEKSNMCVYCAFNCMRSCHSLKLQFGPIVCNKRDDGGNDVDNFNIEPDDSVRQPDKPFMEQLRPSNPYMDPNIYSNHQFVPRGDPISPFDPQFPNPLGNHPFIPPMPNNPFDERVPNIFNNFGNNAPLYNDEDINQANLKPLIEPVDQSNYGGDNIDYDEFIIKEAIKASLETPQEIPEEPMFEEPMFEEPMFEEKPKRVSCSNPDCRNEIPNNLVEEHALLEPKMQYPLFCDECTARYLNNGRYRINRRCPHYETPAKPTEGECTFNLTSTKPVCQWWYECNECYPNKHHIGVCVYCAKECQNSGHSLKSRYGVFYCDKGSGYNMNDLAESTKNITTSPSKTDVFDKIINGE